MSRFFLAIFAGLETCIFPILVPLIFPVSTAAQVTPCRKDGGTFSLSGCEPDACRSFPVDDFKSGYVVCRGGWWEGMGVKMGLYHVVYHPNDDESLSYLG